MHQLFLGCKGREIAVQRQHAVVAAAAQVGRAHQGCGIGIQAGHDEVRTGGHIVRRPIIAKRLRRRTSAKGALNSPGRSRVVAGARRAQHQQLALVIHHQAMRKIRPVAADVGGPHPRRRPVHPGVIFDNGNVDETRKRGPERARAGRVASTEGNAARVQVALRVISRREAPVIGRRAGVGGKYHHRVDGERAGSIVAAQCKMHGAAGQHVAARHGPALAGRVGLPGLRGALGEVAHAGFHHQVAFAVQGQGVGAVVPQADGRRIGLRGQREIILQALVGAFVHPRPNARPQPGVAQLAVAAHIAGPVRGVGPEEIAAVFSGGRFGRE